MKKFILLVIALLLVAIYVFAPVYQFYAHRGAAPMPFWGYETIPDNAPSSNNVYNHHYDEAAQAASLTLEKHRQTINAPGISAAVAIKGEIVWTGTSGWADIADDKAMTSNTQFRIGSTSKALTSTLFARMVQNNQLTIDTPLKSLAIGQLNPAWADITPRHLASHMSGLPHYKENTEIVGLYESMALNSAYEDVTDAVRLFDESELLFAPGEDFSYSSFGTVLLSAVLQEAGQHPYQSLIHDLVLQPLGMHNTSPTKQQKNYEHAASEIATFYWREKAESKSVRPWRSVDLSHRLAGGGFISTPSDLVKLGSGFINEQFINASIREQFWTPQQLNDGQINEQHYALGWRVSHNDLGEGLESVKIANHGGVSRGSQSWLMVLPEYNMAVAVNINCKTDVFWDFGKVSFAIARAFILANSTD